MICVTFRSVIQHISEINFHGHYLQGRLRRLGMTIRDSIIQMASWRYFYSDVQCIFSG